MPALKSSSIDLSSWILMVIISLRFQTLWMSIMPKRQSGATSKAGLFSKVIEELFMMSSARPNPRLTIRVAQRPRILSPKPKSHR